MPEDIKEEKAKLIPQKEVKKDEKGLPPEAETLEVPLGSEIEPVKLPEIKPVDKTKTSNVEDDLGVHNIRGFTSRARAYRNGSFQTIGDSSSTKVQLNAETYDGDGEFDSTTNYRFTATVAGYYIVSASLFWDTVADQDASFIEIKRNGVRVTISINRDSGAGSGQIVVSDIIYLAMGQYLELWATQTSGGDLSVQNGEDRTFMAIHRLS